LQKEYITIGSTSSLFFFCVESVFLQHFTFQKRSQHWRSIRRRSGTLSIGSNILHCYIFCCCLHHYHNGYVFETVERKKERDWTNI
jgi:hypothetical protein